MTDFYKQALKTLRANDFAALSQTAEADYVLMRNYLEREISDLDNEEKDEAKYIKLIPFAKQITRIWRRPGGGWSRSTARNPPTC
jgi:hypothetical protein